MEQLRTTQRKKDILFALANTGGHVTASCKGVGITTETFYKWSKSDEEFRKKVYEINLRQLPLTAANMYRQALVKDDKKTLDKILTLQKSRLWRLVLVEQKNVQVEKKKKSTSPEKPEFQ